MANRKKILIVDVPDVYSSFAPFIHRWGYEVYSIYDPSIDSVLTVISSKRIDLLIIAKELTLKGPSLSDDWKKVDGVEVDGDFGHRMLSRLNSEGIKLPTILLTTDYLNENKWLYDDSGKLDYVIMMKNSTGKIDVCDEMKKAIQEFLGSGLDFHEWAKVLIVGDQIETCRDLEKIFKAGGYHADRATAVREASQKLEETTYDLILIGIEENMSIGLDMMKKLRWMEKRPKIIVISTRLRDELRSVFEKEGIEGFMYRYIDDPRPLRPGGFVDRAVFSLEQYP